MLRRRTHRRERQEISPCGTDVYKRQALIIIFGVGGMTFNIGSFRLGGIGLAAVTGVLLNLFLPRAVHVHKKVKTE